MIPDATTLNNSTHTKVRGRVRGPRWTPPSSRVSPGPPLCCVAAPPVFIKTPPAYVEVLLGDSLTLSCGAHGNPRPTVVWHKDETPIVRHEKIKVGVAG